MRSVIGLLIFAAASIVPRTGSAQVSVTSPAAGAPSSYRKTVISWNPIPGASSYHLEIDDDPNFGSPDVDVTVAGTSYTLSGQLLKLNGRQSWTAYVRINGTRWNANTFTPSYFKAGANPALGVDSQNLVYLAFGEPDRVNLTKSSDWSSVIRLSPEETLGGYGLHVAVDDLDVAHASWMESTRPVSWGPYYANSSTGWNPVRIPGTGTMTAGCSEGSLVAGHGQVDLFYDNCHEKIERWTSTDGLAFAHTSLPNQDEPTSASAARDGVGNLYVASERVTPPDFTIDSALQSSADGWLAHTLGPGRFPRLTVTPSGELHVLRWGTDDEWNSTTGVPFFYSNSLRGFQTWTELPVRTSSFDQDLLPLVVDTTRQQLHTVLTPVDGARLCSSAHTGLANSTGTSWTCRKLDTVGYHTDVAVAPDGTIHVAWGAPGKGLGYANSLGSFLATNFTPQVSFGTPSGGASAVTVPVGISDVDGDDLAGHIQVGRYQPVMSLMERGTNETIAGYTLTTNAQNTYIYGPGNGLQFRVMGGATWVSQLERSGLTLPAQVEIRQWEGPVSGGFFIASWGDTGVTVVQNGFVPHTKLPFSGAPLAEIDISTLPLGTAMVAIGVSDHVTSSFAAQAFTKASGQSTLRLVPLAGP